MYPLQLWLLYCFLVWMMTDLSRGYERILFAAKFSHPSRYAGYPLWPLAPHLPMGMWCIPFIATWCCTLKTAWWCPRSSLSNGWKSIRDKVRKLARHFVPAQWTWAWTPVLCGNGQRDSTFSVQPNSCAVGCMMLHDREPFDISIRRTINKAHSLRS